MKRWLLTGLIPIALWVGILMGVAVAVTAQEAYTVQAPASTANPIVVDLQTCLRQLEADSIEPLRAQAQEIMAQAQKRQVLIKMLPQAEGSFNWIYAPTKIDVISFFESAFPLPIDIPEKITSLMPNQWGVLQTKHMYLGSLSVKQPLFAGGRLITAYRLADLQYRRNELKQDKERYASQKEVTQTYIKTVALIRKEQLLKEFVAKLDSTVRNVAMLQTEGVTTEGELLSIRIARNSASLQLLQVSEGIQALKSLLAYQSKYPSGTELILHEEESANALSPLLVESSEQVEPGQENRRIELQELDVAQRAQEMQSRIALGKMLPQVGFFFNLHTINPNLYKGLKKEFGVNYMLGVSLQIPISDLFSGYQELQMSRAQANLWKWDSQKAQRGIEQQQQQATKSYNRATQMQKHAHSLARDAQENLRLAELGHKEGVTDIPTLLRAQTAWLEAYMALLSAQEEQRLAQLDCTSSQGSPLWTPTP